MDKTGKEPTRSDPDSSDLPEQPAGTSGRDADLQREGNLGNERNRNSRRDEEEESGLGNRGGFTR